MRIFFGLLFAVLIALAAWADGPVDTGGGGGSISVPGLSANGIGNDESLRYYAFQVQGFDHLPSWPELWFSSDDGGYAPAGNDSNPCTPQEPCHSPQHMETLLNRHNVIIRLDHETWANDSGDNDFGSGFDGLNLQNTGCGSGSAGTLTDEPCGFMLPWNPSDTSTRPKFDCTGLGDDLDLGASGNFIITGGTGSGYFGFAGFDLSRCPYTPDDQQRMFEAGGSGHRVVVNMTLDGVAGFESHLLSQTSSTPAHTVALNVNLQQRDHADFDEDCSGSNCADNDGGKDSALCSGLDTPYECCSSDATSVCTAGSHMWEFGEGHHTLIGARMDVNNTGTAGSERHVCVLGPDAAITAGTTSHTFNAYVDCWGPEDLGASTGSGMLCYQGTTQGGTGTLKLDILQSSCINRDATFAPYGMQPVIWDAGTDGFNLQVWLYRNTWKKMGRVFFADSAGDNDDYEWDFHCNLVDQTGESNGNAYVIYSTHQLGSGATMALTGGRTNIYDADDADVPGFNKTFRVDAKLFDDADHLIDSVGTLTSGYTVASDFWGGDEEDGGTSLESGGIGTPGDQFGAYNDSALCDEDENCFQACDVGPFYRPLPTNAFIPTAVSGVKVIGFNVGTNSVRNIGAR